MNEFWRRLCDISRSDNYAQTFAEPGRRVIGVDNYTYTVDGETLSANITNTAPQTFNTIMDSDSDFVLFYFSGFGRYSGSQTMTINPAILLQITDRSTGRDFFNRPAPMAMLCGQGGFPFLLTSPRVIKPRSTLAVQATAAQSQAFSGFYFCYHGARLFYA